MATKKTDNKAAAENEFASLEANADEYAKLKAEAEAEIAEMRAKAEAEIAAMKADAEAEVKAEAERRAEEERNRKVTVMIPWIEGQDPEETVIINGHTTKIRKGEEVEVSPDVAEILSNSNKQALIAAKNRQQMKQQVQDL